MTIYKVSRGNAWDEYDIAYLTEDKLEEYLNAVYNSSWMEQHKHNHLDGINETEKDYKKKLDRYIQSCNFYLHAPKHGQLSKEASESNFNHCEREIIETRNRLKQIQEIKDEVANWDREDWLHHAHYNWEPIRINDMENLERPDDDRTSEDWM